MLDYPKEQLWELHKDLPDSLKEALFSEKIGDNIYEICKRNGVIEKEASAVVKNVGYIFLGLLPPNELSEILKKELNLTKKKAEDISQEIGRYVLLPLKKNIEVLYKQAIKIKRGSKKEESPLKKDQYREPTK